MTNLPSGVNIENLINDLRNIGWEACEILLHYAQILKDKQNQRSVLENDNLDDPVQGEVTIIGEPKEGVTLRALSDSLSDEDGIASISISWETSKDGRNWGVLNSLSGPVLKLNQSLVGSQVRARVAVVDNFGIETNLYSQATRTVENVNNKPSGRIVIRRVGQ